MKNLPNFFDLDLDNFNQNLTDKLNTFRKNIDELTKQKEFTWDTLMLPLDNMDDELSHFWSPVSHLHSVVNSEKLREIYKVAVTELSLYSTEVGQNKALYQAIKSLKPTNDTEKKIIQDELLGFELSGVALEEEQKKRFSDIQTKLPELSTQFETNLLDSTNAWKKEVTNSEALTGMPEHAINTAKLLGAEKNNYVLTLDAPCFQAVVTYADDEKLREEMYQAYVTRASDQFKIAPEFDNSTIIKDLLALKHEKAQLLGFDNYAELSLATKMAPSTSKVMQFLNELANKSQAQAKQEFSDLETYAHKKLNPWDVAYYSEKQQQEHYAISQEDLRPYFPQSKTLQGMFSIVSKLYDIHFEEQSNVSTWHPDVLYFEMYNKMGESIGGLYMDLYARKNKRGGAWMDDFISYRKLSDDTTQTPVAFLTCNFAPPSEKAEAYFSHDEVLTLFHEFGHCLHHLMTNIPYLAAAGINGVEWDAVELPSQIFENWCWQKEALIPLTQHKDTKEPLSDELFDKLIKAKNFQSAMTMLRQIEFSLFDFMIHKDYNAKNPEDVLTTITELRKKLSVIPSTPYNRFPQAFSHIFAGGYAAGYYSYKWAEVLSSDAFSKFEEEGILNEKTGKAFLTQLLSRGSSRSALASFIAFRGREPSIDALIRHNGITG